MKVNLKIVLPVLAAAVAAPVALFFAGSTAPVDWKEYESPEYSFAISFPVDPTLEATTFRTVDGRSLEAHAFSVEQPAGVFKVTVVEMPGEETGEEAPVVKDAAKNVAEGGVIKFDFPHSVGAIYGANSASLGQTGLFLRGAVFTRSRGKLWSLMPCASTNRLISLDPAPG